MWICDGCRSQNNDEANFCGKCGYSKIGLAPPPSKPAGGNLAERFLEGRLEKNDGDMGLVIYLKALIANLRWPARILSVLIVAFWSRELIYHFFIRKSYYSSRWPTEMDGWIMLIAVFTHLAALILAWKWEIIGGLVTLVCVAVMYIGRPNNKYGLLACAVPLIAALLFVICGVLSYKLPRPRKEKNR